MKNFDELANIETINKTIEELKKNGITATIVDNAGQALEKIKEKIPQGSEVMNMSSATLDSTEISKEINETGNYRSVKAALNELAKDMQAHKVEMKKLGAAPEWTVGSVHAVTEDGKIVVASNTGSQLPAYAYGSAHVILVVGTQKIVKDLDEAFKRVYEYVLPLESERVKKAYGMQESFVSKLLIINKEVDPTRINVIFVNEKLGF